MANNNPNIQVTIGLKAIDMGIEKTLSTIFSKLSNIGGITRDANGLTAVFRFKTDFKNPEDLTEFTQTIEHLQKVASEQGIDAFIKELSNCFDVLEKLNNAPRLSFAEQVEKDLDKASEAIDKFQKNTKASQQSLTDLLSNPTKKDAKSFNKLASSYQSQIQEVSDAFAKAMGTAVDSGNGKLVDDVQKKIKAFTSSLEIDSDKFKQLTDLGFDNESLTNIKKQIDALNTYKEAAEMAKKAMGEGPTSNVSVGVELTADSILQAVNQAVEEYNGSVAKSAPKVQLYGELPQDNINIDTEKINEALKGTPIKPILDLSDYQAKIGEMYDDIEDLRANALKGVIPDKYKKEATETAKQAQETADALVKAQEKAQAKATVKAKIKNIAPLHTVQKPTQAEINKAAEESVKSAEEAQQKIQDKVEEKLTQTGKEDNQNTPPIEYSPKVDVTYKDGNVDLTKFTEDVRKLISDSLTSEPIKVEPTITVASKEAATGSDAENESKRTVEEIKKVVNQALGESQIDVEPKLNLTYKEGNIAVDSFAEGVKKLISDSLDGMEIIANNLNVKLGEGAKVSGELKGEAGSVIAGKGKENTPSTQSLAGRKKASDSLQASLNESIKSSEKLGKQLDELKEKYANIANEKQKAIDADKKERESNKKIESYAVSDYENSLNQFSKNITGNKDYYNADTIRQYANAIKELKQVTIKDASALPFDEDSSSKMEKLKSQVVDLMDYFDKTANGSVDDVQSLTKAINLIINQMKLVNDQADATSKKFSSLKSTVDSLDDLQSKVTVASNTKSLASLYPNAGTNSEEFQTVNKQASALKGIVSSMNTVNGLQEKINEKRKELGTNGNLAPVQQAIEAISNEIVGLSNNLNTSIKALDKLDKASAKAKESSGVTGEDLNDVFSRKLGKSYEMSKEPQKYFTDISGDNSSGLISNITKAREAMDAFLSDVKSKGDLSKGEVKDLTKQFGKLQTAIQDAVSATNVSKRSTSNGSILETLEKGLSGSKLKDTVTQIDAIKAALKGATNISWDTSSFTKAGQEVTKLTANFVDQEGQLKTIKVLYNSVTGEVTELGTAMKEGQSIGEKFKNILKNEAMSFTSFLATGASFYQLINTVKQGISIITEVDTAMTELRKVSNATQQQLDDFRTSAFQVADTIGSTGKDVIQAASDWQKLGYSLKDAQELAKNSAIYMNVGDIDNADTATADLVSTMKAFNLTADDSIDIVNKLNEVGNDYAIDSAGLGEALKRSSAALAQGGNDLDESIGLIVGANAVLQDPETAGQALKTISLRLRKTKVELTDVGEDAAGAAESISDLREKVIALSGVDIMKDENTYKSTFEILQQISQVYDKLTDKNRAGLLELLAGL